MGLEPREGAGGGWSLTEWDLGNKAPEKAKPLRAGGSWLPSWRREP